MKHLPSSIHRWLCTTSLTLPILIALVACQSAASTPLSTAAPTTEMPNTPSPEVLLTQTAASTQVETASSTETPEPTNPPTLTPTLMSPPYTIGEFPITQKGPWLLFLAAENHPGGGCFINDRYLWAINQGGTWAAKLEHEPVRAFAVRPGSTTDGAAVAYISGSLLKIIKLPSGEVTTITPLTGDSLKWSPDGSTLAFIGAVNGDTADLYTYDYAGGGIARRSDQPGKKSNLSWSPDGKYLAYDVTWNAEAASHKNIWVVQSDGANTRLLAGDSEETGLPALYEWLDETKVSLFTGGVPLSQYTYQYTGIHAVDVGTGSDTLIIEEPFVDAAFSKEYNTWLLRDDERDTPLVLYRSGQRTEIPDDGIGYMWWSSDYDVFFGEVMVEDVFYYTLTPGGETAKLVLKGPMTFDPFVPSPDGKWWGWLAVSSGSRWVGAGAAWSEPRDVIQGANSMDFIWSPDSSSLIALDILGLFIAKTPDFSVSQSLSYICGTTSPEFWSPWQAAWIQ
jgi:hypothetical protein